MPIHVSDAHQDTAFVQRQTGLLFNLPPPDPALEQKPEGLSLCMIVKNEERFLAECLESVVGVVDEINIVDTGSTDRTVEIARSYDANVIFREWRNDFSWARNESLQLATKRWILVLDADEELSTESRTLMRALRTVPADVHAVYLRIFNHIDDLAGFGSMSHILPRIFPNHSLIRYRNVIHEALTLDGDVIPSVVSPIAVIHKGYTAEMLTGREKSARNLPLVRKALEENANDPFALFNFGTSAIGNGHFDEGITALEKMLTLNIETKAYYATGYMMLALGHFEHRRDIERGLEVLELGLEPFPTDPNLLFTKAQILREARRLPEARATLDRLLAARQAARYAPLTDDEIFEWKAHYLLAGICEAEGDVEGMVAALRVALTNRPSPFLKVAEAKALERAGRYHEADLAFRELQTFDPERGIVERLNFLLRRERFAQALETAEELLGKGPSAVTNELRVVAARALAMDRAEEAIPLLRAVLADHPAHGGALAMLEMLLRRRGDVHEIPLLRKAELAATCRTPGDFLRRSSVLLESGRNQDALEAARAGLALSRDDAELRYNFALAQHRVGDDDGALASFEAVSTRDRSAFAHAMAARSQLLLQRGDEAGAFEALSRWAAADPESVDAALARAAHFERTGRLAEARAELEPLMEREPRVALELASLLMRAGDIAGAGRVAAASLAVRS